MWLGKRDMPVELCRAYNSKGIQSHDEWVALRKQGPNWGVDAEFYQFGKPRSRAGARTDVINMVEQVRQGKTNRELIEYDPALYCRLYKAIDRVRMFYKPKREGKPQIILLQGPPEVGKTRWAFEKYPSIWEPAIGSNGNWFDGYDGEKEVLLDEFEGIDCLQKPATAISLYYKPSDLQGICL